MRRSNPRSVIGWTLLSVIAPGAAHLRAGHRRTGWIMVGLWVALLIALAVTVLIQGKALASLILDPTLASVVTTASWIACLLWAAIVVSSYVAMRPGRLQPKAQISTGVTAGMLAVAVALPFTFVANAVSESNSSIDTIFKSRTGKPVNHTDPWEGRDRINIALLGGDGAASRTGVGIRTDSINVVSIDVKTGNSVIFALPREMENVPFSPNSLLGRRFPPPKNFWLPGPDRAAADLLNGVWAYAEMHPEVAGHSPTRSGDAIKDALGQTLGFKVDYYMLINMWGVARLIDALGGVTINVEQDICYGVGRTDGGIIKAGTHRLDGEQALWYGRARDHPGSTCAGGDNHTRMRRQQCVMNAMLTQLNPGSVLLRFNALARAAKQTFITDIPRDLLQDLVPLAEQVKGARVSTLNLVPPNFNPAYPDYMKIRKAVNVALFRSRRPATAVAKAPTPSSTRPSSTASSTTATPIPRPTLATASLNSSCVAPGA